MKIAVRYYTKTGNTKRLAEAIFVSSLDKEKVGRIINFGSAAMMNSTWKKVKAVADKTGIPMDEREFHCKGEFKGVHKGKPDETDLNAAAEFARKIVKDPAGY